MPSLREEVVKEKAENYLDAIRAYVNELRSIPEEYEPVYEGGMPVGSVQRERKEFVTAEEIAEKLNIPKHFVTQCLHKLNLEGLVGTRILTKAYGPGEGVPKLYYLRR